MIKYIDLEAQRAVIQAEIRNNIDTVMSHGQFILGPEVYLLEEKLSEYVGAKYCISCANGTDALQIALMAVGVGAGDEVITPSFSYIAAAEAITLLGATPVYADVDPETCNINVGQLRNLITDKTKAIVPVSLYGYPANFDVINPMADEFGIVVIEDAAQSFGASVDGKKSCNLSTIGCTSFFPTKPLGCYGDGGAIFTSDPHLGKKIRQIATHGQNGKYNHELLGVNSRLDTLQAAILLPKLQILDGEILKRQQLSELYNDALRSVFHVKTPAASPSVQSAWAQYTLQVDNRNQLQAFLKSHNIPTAVHYPRAVSDQPAVKDLAHEYPVSRRLAKSVISLPIHAYLSESNISHIVDLIRSFYTK